MERLETITTEMTEHICDNICKHPGAVKRQEISQDVLDVICSECKMGQFVCDITNAGIEFDKMYIQKCQEVTEQKNCIYSLRKELTKARANQ